MYFHKPQEKPRKWGSFQDVQYAVMKNCEKIYGVDPDSIVLAMPLFWGLPPLDYSGENNHGTNQGATYKDGSLSFDAIDDRIDISLLQLTNFTASMWIYPVSPNIYGGLITHSNINGLFYFSDKLNWYLGGSHLSNTFMTRNQWQFVTVVVNGGTLYFYLNGSIDGQHTLNPQPSFSYIGSDNANEAFNEKIDEVRISNVAHSAEQVALFHDNPWALYQPISRPVYFFQAAEGISIPVVDHHLQQHWRA